MNWNLYNDPNCCYKRSGVKDGFTYFALVDYYSKKDYPELPVDDQSNREMIWNFKDGHNSEEVGEMMARAIKNLMKKASDKQTQSFSFSPVTASIIPASTANKTFNRFYSFLENFCDQLQCKNGYNIIALKHDHEPTKGNTQKEVLQYFNFNASAIQNQDFFLIDDVKTTGRSFSQCAKELKRLGAKAVIGIFLGETYSSYKHGTPDWVGKAQQPSPPRPTFDDSEVDDLPF